MYKAYVKKNPKKIVALKKIEYKSVEYGFPITALREIKLLKSCDHKNVVHLLDIFTSKRTSSPFFAITYVASTFNNHKGSTFLVFDYVEHDFFSMFKAKVRFDGPQVKCIMKQILEGVEYLHSKGIMHRDLKTANILMNNRGEIKIADFGLARLRNSPSGYYSNSVVTLWYRAPELLLGGQKYGFGVDIWSLGCIFSELLTGHILFKEQKEQQQFEKICEKCGVPTEVDWPGVSSLKHYHDFAPKRMTQRTLIQHLKELKQGLDPLALELIDRMLQMNPEKRITVTDALQHKYFNDPSMLEPEE